MSNFKAKVIEDFLTKTEIDEILKFAKSQNQWESGGDFWDNRVFNVSTIGNSYSKELGDTFYRIRGRISKAISELYSVSHAYPDTTQLVRWFPGLEQAPHADDMTNADGHEWFHHREYGAIIYLNDDYSGGETYYPQHNFSISPKAGMLAIHPGDPNHMHGVTKIDGGIRYTISSFWTTNKEFYDGLPIY